MSYLPQFYKMAEDKYPLTSDAERNRYIMELRTEYISALVACQSHPAFAVRLTEGSSRSATSSEHFISADTQGWQTVKNRSARAKTYLTRPQTPTYSD
jgi:hypothetical protein